MRTARGAARLVTIVSVLAGGLGLAAVPAGAAPALTVTPGPTGLLDRQVVTVTGSGFEPGEDLLVVQCIGTVPDSCPADPVVNTNAAHATADGDGDVSATLRLPRTIEYGDDDSASCQHGDCSIVAIALDDGAERARTFVDFEATGTAPLPSAPAFTIGTVDTSVTTATVTLTGSGFWPWFRATPWAGPGRDVDVSLAAADAYGSAPGAHLALCRGGTCEVFAGPAVYSQDGGASPLNGMSPTRAIAVAADGTVSAQLTIPRIWKTQTERIDCAQVPCSFALVQDDLRSATATVEWAGEATPWRSSGDLIDDAYAALVGTEAPADEYAYYRSALLDRTLTARDLLFGLAEHADGLHVAELTRLYRAALDRRPDAAGLTYWVGELERTGSMSAIARAFGRTPEFRTMFGSVSDAQAVGAAYQRTLGRQPSSQERAYWLGRLQAGLARTHMIHLFSRTPEYLAREQHRSAIVAIRHGFLGTVSSAGEWAALDPDLPRDPNPFAPPPAPARDRADDALLALIASGALTG